MIESMTGIQYASKFIELSRFIPKFVASEMMKIGRFDKGLALYVCNQLAANLAIPIKNYTNV